MIRTALILLSLVVLAGMLTLWWSWKRPYNTYRIDGAVGVFRVPKTYDAPSIFWVLPSLWTVGSPGVDPNRRGIVFDGCWTGNLVPRLPDCAFPTAVLGGTVLPLSRYHRVSRPPGVYGNWRWKELGAGSWSREDALDSRATLEAVDDGTLVVVHHPRNPDAWDVWRKAVPLPAGASPHLEDDDELLVRCRIFNVAMPYEDGRPPHQDRRPAVMCSRLYLGPDYGLQYSFESPDRIPRQVDELDAQVIAQIERWRHR